MIRAGPLSTIAVDLTPLMPGGDNGGAKIFSIELINRLAALHRSVQFVLLTQSASHEDLSFLDASNVRRRLVEAGSEGRAFGVMPAVRKKAGHVTRKLPQRARSGLSGLRRRVRNWPGRRKQGDLLTELGADLLFCPFTSPRHAEIGVPTICVVHDLQYKVYPQFFEPEDVFHRDVAFADAVGRSVALVAVSEYTRQSILEYSRVDPSRVCTIHHRMAQRLGFEAPADRSLIDRHRLLPDRYLLYPANFWRHKNHEMLLLAFGLAMRNGLPDDVALVCTGAPGDRQAYLVESARRMGIGHRLRFPGYVSNEEFSTLLHLARALVFPSLYEGFGMPIVEAMAAGVPVACSNTTALPEVVDEAGILFDPRVPARISDAIVQVCCDGERREQIVAAGKSRATGFMDLDRMAGEYWDLFQRSAAGVLPHGP